MFLPTFLDQSVEHLLAWHVNLSHTNVNLLNTKMLYRRSVQQNYISNIKLFDRLTLVLFDRFSGKIFQQIYMCDRFTPWFSVQQICKLAKLRVQICWTNQLMVDAVIYSTDRLILIKRCSGIPKQSFYKVSLYDNWNSGQFSCLTKHHNLFLLK